ncbi:MAG: TolB family protein, partial [Gaiellales bacterium]
DSIRAIIDCSGDHIVFASGAALIPADVNAQDDIYRWTRGVGVELASLKDDEGQFNKSSQRPWISPEGNWVVFQTAATNVPGDTNGNHDIYLRNMTAGTTTLVSLKADGTQPGGANTRGVVSDNGRYVAWAANSPLVNTDKNGRRDVYVRDMTLLPSTGIVRVSERTDHTEGACPATAAASTGGYTTAARAGTTNISTRPTISADGMRIGYTSSFCTLDPDDGTPVDDIYLTVRT